MVSSEAIAIDPEETALSEVPYADTIAAIISALKDEGDAAYEKRESEGHFWRFNYGTVAVVVHLTGSSESDRLSVWSEVLPLPSRDDAALAQELLASNWQDTGEARFAFWDNSVVVNTTRTLQDTGPAEIARAITVVATLADDYDEPLIAKYGSAS